MNRRDAIVRRDTGAAAQALLDNATLKKALNEIEADAINTMLESINDEMVIQNRALALGVRDLRNKLASYVSAGKLASRHPEL